MAWHRGQSLGKFRRDCSFAEAWEIGDDDDETRARESPRKTPDDRLFAPERMRPVHEEECGTRPAPRGTDDLHRHTSDLERLGAWLTRQCSRGTPEERNLEDDREQDDRARSRLECRAQPDAGQGRANLRPQSGLAKSRRWCDRSGTVARAEIASARRRG